MMCSIRCMSTFARAFDVMNHKTDGQQLAILPRNRNREYFFAPGVTGVASKIGSVGHKLQTATSCQYRMVTPWKSFN